jgi:DnaA-homolog protein
MQQLTLPIIPDAAPTFDSFVVGSNAAALAHLQQLPQHSAPAFLWGPSGSGKTHLLQALAFQLQRQGGRVAWFHPGERLPWCLEDGVALVVFDNCDRLDADQQQAAFGLFVDAGTLGIPVLGAARMPPVDLLLREDLRTRLGWGPVFALQPLSEAETRGALRCEADRRGLFLSDEVISHLLTRFDRNLKNLMALLDRLDHFALVHQRAITIPLLKKMLTEDVVA